MTFRAGKPFARVRRYDLARVDELVGLLLLIEIELQLWLSPHLHHRLPAAIAGVVLATAVAVRRRWPLAAVLVAVGVVTAQQSVGGMVAQDTVGVLPAMILLSYGAGSFLAVRRAWLALALALAGSCAGTLIAARPLSGLIFTSVFVFLLPWTIGRIMRERGARERAYRERSEHLDAQRDHLARTAAYEERSRIARELHDVIAHSVSVMVIQAGAARTVMGSEPERAEMSLRSVEGAGREALAEMRRLFGMLDSGKHSRALLPQPGLADIEDLLERTRGAGIATDLSVEGQPAMVSPALDLCAYRIVQEALTNVIKHAGPARAAVRVRWGWDVLELDVLDDGRGPVDANGTSCGHGIAGMRERSALHGGSIQAGAGAGGGFAVRARLPLATEHAR